MGPSETKAERPAAEKGFWNRFDATAKCRVVEGWREGSKGSPKAQTIPDREAAKAQSRQAGLSKVHADGEAESSDEA
jgi:nitrous oxide reductase accessory protein NosL